MTSPRSAAIRAAATLLAAATLIPLAATAHADSATEVLGPTIVQNGGFEQGAFPGVHLQITPGSPLLSNWTAFGSEVSVYGTYWQAEEGTRSLALANPSTGVKLAGGVKQTITTQPGQRYRVIFYQAENPNDHQPSVLRFEVAGQTRDYTFQEPATATVKSMVWVKREFVFTAAGAATPLSFTAFYTPGNDPLGLDNVQVRAIQPAAGNPGSGNQAPAVKTALSLSAASLAAGGSEGIAVIAAPNAPVAVVIDAPNGTQVVVPGRADAAGHYAYTWPVPSGLSGNVQVFADSAGSIAQGSFTVH